MSTLAPQEAPVTLSTFEGFISGGIAACTAVTVTNPMEVIKTRLQLDGELEKKSDGRKRVYKGPFDCFKKTFQNEGIRGVQKGLNAAYTYQIALNGSRLGFYDPIRHLLNSLAGYEDVTKARLVTSISAGAASGAIGAILGNPLFLIKARMQAFSPHNPVGVQYNYSGVLSATRTIIKEEGVKGLARGVDAAALRTVMGSSVQLPSYNLAKDFLKKWGFGDHIGTYLLSSFFSGFCVLIMMQPADTVTTRMYNQAPNSVGPDGKPRGLLYKNPIDCLYKTFKTEGIMGWYKGTTAHLLRIGPHTVITLVANEYVSQKWLAYKRAKVSSRD